MDTTDISLSSFPFITSEFYLYDEFTTWTSNSTLHLINQFVREERVEIERHFIVVYDCLESARSVPVDSFYYSDFLHFTPRILSIYFDVSGFPEVRESNLLNDFSLALNEAKINVMNIPILTLIERLPKEGDDHHLPPKSPCP